MDNSELKKVLSTAGAVEESMVGTLAKVMSFYLGNDSNYGLPEADLKTIRAGLDVLMRDTKKHRDMIEEIKTLIEGGI